MLDKFIVLEKFRESPSFKELSPYQRKTIINIGKMYPETLFEEKGTYFKNDNLTKFVKFEEKTVQNDKVSTLLSKIKPFNRCFRWNSESLFQITRFTFCKSLKKPEFLYHTTDAKPEEI